MNQMAIFKINLFIKNYCVPSKLGRSGHLIDLAILYDYYFKYVLQLENNSLKNPFCIGYYFFISG